MLSYRYMHMAMDGLRDGTDRLSDQEVLASGKGTYMVAPQEMTMEMHMFGAMYAPSDDWTLMAMLPYVRKSMTMKRMMMGGGTATFKTRSEGLGDLKLSAMPVVWRGNQQQVHLNLGISAPTGSVEEEDDILQMNGTSIRNRIAYGMQTGSGTWDFLPGVTYLGQSEAFSWGAQLGAVLRLGENSQDYTFGNEVRGTVWGAVPLSDSLSLSARLLARKVEKISGQDSALAAMAAMAPPADADNYGGTYLDAGFGLNYYSRSGLLQGHRFALEFLVPVYMDLNGPQLEPSWTLIAGWQFAW